jgi:hypothetical protein
VRDVTLRKLEIISRDRKERDIKFKAYSQINTNFDDLIDFVKRSMEI